ncbi:Uncharacterised protein [Chlamydia trachomatis]|nr:Uncharacterised protein [Chlamydia trachomatis]
MSIAKAVFPIDGLAAIITKLPLAKITPLSSISLYPVGKPSKKEF